MSRHFAMLIVLAVLAMSSCKGGRPAVKMYDGVGVIVSIDRDRGTITIDHQDIAGYMTAMTMSFKARRPSLLDNLEPGNRVEFKLRDDGSQVVLVKISKTPE